jgi:hypothetical protein
MTSEQDASVLSLIANAAGTAHFVTKSLLAMDLIPLLTSLAKDQQRIVVWALDVNRRDYTQDPTRRGQ